MNDIFGYTNLDGFPLCKNCVEKHYTKEDIEIYLSPIFADPKKTMLIVCDFCKQIIDFPDSSSSKKQITDDDFDRIFQDILGETSRDSILAIPGVKELVAEELNNEIIHRYLKLVQLN